MVGESSIAPDPILTLDCSMTSTWREVWKFLSEKVGQKALVLVQKTMGKPTQSR